MSTSEFRHKVAPHININISPNAALPRLISKFKIVYECSKTLLNFSPCSNFISPSPLPNALPSLYLFLPERRAGTAWEPS
jgi:hypothetical protein